MGGASGEIISKDEFKYFVDETMKAKDNVKNANGKFFISRLRQRFTKPWFAREIYTWLVTMGWID